MVTKSLTLGYSSSLIAEHAIQTYELTVIIKVEHLSFTSTPKDDAVVLVCVILFVVEIIAEFMRARLPICV